MGPKLHLSGQYRPETCALYQSYQLRQSGVISRSETSTVRASTIHGKAMDTLRH